MMKEASCPACAKKTLRDEELKKKLLNFILSYSKENKMMKTVWQCIIPMIRINLQMMDLSY